LIVLILAIAIWYRVRPSNEGTVTVDSRDIFAVLMIMVHWVQGADYRTGSCSSQWVHCQRTALSKKQQN